MRILKKTILLLHCMLMLAVGFFFSTAAALEENNMPYSLFPKPLTGWVGDVMPMNDGDNVQLYFLQDARDGQPGGFHPIHKFTTKDLLSYQYDGLVIPFGESFQPDFAIGTGSVIVVDGTYHCFYTGHNPLYPQTDRPKESVMHAVSTDNITYEKIRSDTFTAPNGYDCNEFRDPFVFWNDEAGEYWMLVSARKDESGVIALFTSDDLTTWQAQEPLYAPGSYFMLECADLFQMGDYYYLVFSEQNGCTRYVMSTSSYGPWTVPTPDVFDGKAFYAAKTAELAGTRYLFGWIPTKPDENDGNDYEWAGNMAVLELWQRTDGTLAAKMPQAYLTYFTQDQPITSHATLGDAALDDDKITIHAQASPAGVDLGLMPETMLLSATVTFDGVSRGAGIAVGFTDDLSRGYGIHMDMNNGILRSDSCLLESIRLSPKTIFIPYHFEANVPIDFKAVVEHDLIVVYLNDEIALSSRIYRMTDHHFGFYSLGGSVTFDDIRVMVAEK